MRSLDTNVLVRYRAADEPRQLAAAEAVIEGCRENREPLFLPVLESYRDGKGSFADYLIGEISRHAGCPDTVTFDRALRCAAGFTVL